MFVSHSNSFLLCIAKQIDKLNKKNIMHTACTQFLVSRDQQSN